VLLQSLDARLGIFTRNPNGARMFVVAIRLRYFRISDYRWKTLRSQPSTLRSDLSRSIAIHIEK